MTADLKFVGKRIPRQDGQAKVAGEYVYGMDFRVDGELQGTILRSPHPYARILSIDTSQARTLEGVEAILTAADLPDDLLMPGMVADQPPLARGVVRYHGEPVALIAARTLEIAEEARTLIRVEYQPLPPLTDPEEALKPDAPLLHPDWESYKPGEEHLVRYGNVCCHASLRKGDVEAGFAEADLIVEDVLTTSSVHQSHLEPRVATGIASGDEVTVYTGTQLPYWIRTNVAHVMGLPEEAVRIVTTGIGGAFGSKLYPQIEPLVALLSRATGGKPVRLVVPLSDELRGGLPRHPSKTWLKTGVKKDGTLVARQARLILDAGAYAGSSPEIASVCVLVLSGPYRTEHVHLDALAPMTNKANFGAYRGPGGPQPLFALESHLDHVADALGMDRLAFRLKNIVDEGDEMANGQIVRAVGLREAAEKAAAAIEWDKPAGPNRGKGLSVGWWTTTLQLSTTLVELDESGKIIVNVGAPEMGTGAIMGGVPQVVAETMGVGMDDVEVVVNDTSSGLWDWGSQGSRTLFNVGRAAQAAGLELAEKIKELAEKVLEVPASNLKLEEGHVFNAANPDERISLADLARYDTNRQLKSRTESKPEFAKYDDGRLTSCLYPAFHHPSFHCHAAEVEVDPGTGEVTVLRYVAAHDVGKAVNPTLVEGQIHGGVVQGIGMAFMEEILYDDQGYMTNPNWTDYKLPTLADAPEVAVIIVEHPTDIGPYGTKGLGESPVIHPPAALANAVAQAIGARVPVLPMTPEQVLKVIKAKESAS